MGGHEKPIASISVNIPMSRLPQESEADFGAAVNEAARSLSARLR
jgi:IclR family acetate operon transcriptional repressor